MYPITYNYKFLISIHMICSIIAWTLMGHEYMELRNTAAAVQCYRNAVHISEVYLNLFIMYLLI